MTQPDGSTDRRGVLLLGGTGFIGSNLSRVLATVGHRVFVTGRNPGTATLPPGVLPVPVGLHTVADLAAFVAHEALDTVVHLVSGMKPVSGLADYLTEREAVMAPTVHFASMLADAGVRLIYFSSGGTIYGAASGRPAAEDHPCEPISFYGQSKLEIELHLQFLQRVRGLHALIVRPSNPYGPHQALNGTQGLVSVLLGRVAERRRLEVWGDGTNLRDYLHIDDLVATTRALIERGVHGTVLNLGSGEGHSLLEVVRIVEQVTGHVVPLAFRPARTADVPRLVLDVGRLRELGLFNTRPLADGIRSYAASLGLAADG